MIKLFPTIKNKNLNSYYFNKHNNENISQTTNPLVAYMDLYFDFKPKTKSSFGLGDLLNAAMSGYSNKTEEAETKTIEDNITETISDTESVSISQTKTQTRSTFIYDEEEYIPRKAYKKKKHGTSIFKHIKKGILQLITFPFKVVWGNIKVINSKTKEKKIQNKIKKTQNISNVKELKQLQETFEQQLKRYQKMFKPDDIMPDLSIFSYKKLSLNELKKLLKVLDACITHQGIIISLKKKYLHTASSYANEKQDANIQHSDVNELEIPYRRNKRTYRKHLDEMYQQFLESSKEIETPILDFNQISNNFFDRAKSSIEEIFEMKKKWYFKYLEKIPKLGLVPKSIRVTGQINLTRCIMKDYKAVTEKYITNGMNPMLQKYNNQYDKIKNFIERYHNILDEADLKYSNTILAKLSQVRRKHLESYKKLFDIFTKGGCNISNICNTVRLQGLVSLITKTISTFGSPF